VLKQLKTEVTVTVFVNTKIWKLKTLGGIFLGLCKNHKRDYSFKQDSLELVNYH